LSDDGPEWFAPKRFGYGVGLPISWQGWAVMLGFIGVTFALCRLFKGQPLQLIAVLVPFLIAFVVITHRTTRGGWRWRWDDRD
jgi:hypothetical protein